MVTSSFIASLELLETVDRAVLIWDADRICAVWGNSAAIALFGERSLADLCERHFAQDEPLAVAARKAVAGSLALTERLTLFTARRRGQALCKVQPHALPDGRIGVMIDIEPDQTRLVEPKAAMRSEALAHLPNPILIAKQDGNIVFCNESASTHFGNQRTTLPEILGEEPASDLNNTLAAGAIFSEALDIDTATGSRRYRVEARRFRDPAMGQALALVSFRDIGSQAILQALDTGRRARLDAYLAAAADFTWEADAGGRITAVSPSAAAVTRRMAAQILGRSWQAVGQTEPLPEPPQAFRDHPLLIQGPGDGSQMVLLSAVPFAEPDGTASAYRGIGRVVPAATLAVSDTEAAQAMAMLEALPDGLLVLDGQGRIAFANGPASALLETTAETLRGHRFASLLTRDARTQIRSAIARLDRGEFDPLLNDGREIAFITGKGSTRSLLLTFRPLDLTAGPAFCVLLRDMSAWRAVEAELKRARDDAEAANRQKSEFLAKVSHELRTPLNAIMGFAEIMRDERLGPVNNPRYLGYLGDIHHSGQLLLSLINDLLDLSKVEAGKMELKPENVDIGQLIKRCVNLMTPAAEAAHVTLEITLAGHLPAIVADERSVEQIILNLLSNAVKFTDAGGRVRVTADFDAEGGVSLHIRDTGIGMSATDLERALEPYQRAENATVLGKPGTGLGLPLAKALAEANRAEFRIASSPRAGTSIEIRFPSAQVVTS